MDLGAEFGEQGFRWIVLMHMHGASDHHQALDDAASTFEMSTVAARSIWVDWIRDRIRVSKP